MYSPAAIAVINNLDDPDQNICTKVRIINNYLHAEAAELGTLTLGLRQPPNLFDQSLKYGEVSNNEITNGNVDIGDAITSHHFVGKFYNNRLKSGSEGLHLGLGWVDDYNGRHQDYPLISITRERETHIKHNLFIGNRDEGLHFTHGSRGEVRNNIMVGARELIAVQGVDVKTGIFIGETHIDSDVCDGDSTECVDPGLPAGFVVDVVVRNNTIDYNAIGVKVTPDARTELFSNIITRTDGVSGESAGIIKSKDESLGPHYFAGYNLLWGHAQADYGSADLEAAAPTDLDSKTVPLPHPRFRGWLSPDEISYMLKTTGVPSACYPTHPAHQSSAIDAGDPAPDEEDPATHTPSLGGPANDIGAYGGPDAAWDQTLPPTNNQGYWDECLEYTAMP